MENISQNLNIILANSYSLYLKTQNYHWNVTGPNFYQLHLLLEKQYEDLAEAADTIAERVRALGSIVSAGFDQFSKLRTLEDGSNTNSWQQMLQDLYDDHSQLVSMMNELAAMSADNQDIATEDLMVERVREHEEMMWMLKSHLTH